MKIVSYLTVGLLGADARLMGSAQQSLAAKTYTSIGDIKSTLGVLALRAKKLYVFPRAMLIDHRV